MPHAEQSQSLITIVVPVHNRADLVRDCLASIAAQTAAPLDVVLVDNASTDRTADVLRDWAAGVDPARLRVTVLSEPRPGACRARNTGLRAVRTPWVMFFDSDDTMRTDHCRRALDAAARHPEASIIGWNVMLHTLDGGTRTLPFSSTDPLYCNVMFGTMATQRYMARTELVRAAGGWDDDLRSWNDIELGCRLLARRPVPVHAGSEITVDVRQQTESLTGTSFSRRAGELMLSLERMSADGVPAAVLGLKGAILGADMCREGRSDLGRDVAARTLAPVRGHARRLLLRAVFRLRRSGVRGLGRLLLPLFRRCR